MAKICSNCGLKHKDSATKCAGCNAPLEELPVHKKKKVYVILAAILLVLIGVSTFFIMRCTGPDGTVRRIMRCYSNNDPEGVVDFFPEFLFEANWITREMLVDQLSGNVKEISDYMFSYYLEDTKTPSTSEMNEIMAQLNSFPDFDEDQLDDVKYITVNFKGNATYLWTANDTRFVMIKYDGSWYWWPFDTIF